MLSCQSLKKYELACFFEIFKFAVKTCFIIDNTCKIINEEGVHK